MKIYHTRSFLLELRVHEKDAKIDLRRTAERGNKNEDSRNKLHNNERNKEVHITHHRRV